MFMCVCQMLGNPDSKPQFFSDKTLEPVIKNIVRKFPALDSKGSNVSASVELIHLTMNHILFEICGNAHHNQC
jgi:hypothetical protein